MPIFTAAVAVFAAVSSFFASVGTIGTFLITTAASIGLSYAAKALAGTPSSPAQAVDHFSVQGTLQSAGDVPRSFNVGYSVTAGSLVYGNFWGNSGNTPNAYITQVIALSDLPGGTLVEVWVNGELCTLGGTESGSLGFPVTQYNKGGADHLWIKYHDGTQTTADGLLTGSVSSADRPYESTRVGTGVSYAICTALVEDTLFTGIPTFKFAVSGVSFYDPTKDSTNGGSGSHRYSDPTTWGGDGDNLPAVQAYNIMRGIYYAGLWVYGMQGMTASRLPAINWNAQINKCRALVVGTAGNEPTYRTGGQINVSAQIGNTLEALMTGCQGKISEIGGFYKIHLGTPDATAGELTDDLILSTEEQNFAPFFGLANSINGITATYPDPAQGWNTTTAPPYFVSAFETQDGNRRLLANPAFDFVPYAAQVQRLQKSAVEEARRERRHTLVLPPEYWALEPGDVISWASVRNGYEDKLFRVDGAVDKANLDVIVNLTEVDPTDYDWNHDTDFQPVTSGAVTFPRPSPQGIVDWFAEPAIIKDGDGVSRRPAIRLSWDGSLPGVVGVQYEVRLAADESEVMRGRTDQLAVGAILISQSLLPDTDYEARGQYLPSAPRDMLWSDWLPVTTPDIKISIAEFDAALVYQVTAITDALNDQIEDLNQRMSTLVSSLGAQGWTDIKSVRSQLFATAGGATAEIDEVRTVAVDAASAVATLDTTVSATFGPDFSTVNTVSTAVATLDGYAAAEYAVTLNVDGYATGFNLLNGGSGLSEFVVMADKIQFAYPTVNGGAPVPFLTTGVVGGVAAIGVTGNFYLDGSLTTRMISAGAITTITLDAQAVTAAKIAANTITASQIATGTITSASGAIGALSVTSLSIGDNAVTVPAVQTAVNPTTLSFSLSINTAGLAGKTITVYASASMAAVFDVFFATATSADLFINGSRVMLETGFGSLTVAGAGTFTASGGTDVIAVTCNFTGSPTSGTLFAMAAKR